MKFPFFSSPSLLGLDIQAEGIYAVQLKKTRNTFLVEHIDAIPLPHPIFAEGKIKDWDALCVLLSSWVKTRRIENMATAIHLPAHLVRMQRLSLPSGLSEVDIEAEIAAHVQRDLVGMAENLCIDFVMLPQKNSLDVDVFFTVAREDYLSQYLACLKEARLDVKIIDVDIYSLKRAISFALPSLRSSHLLHAVLHRAHQTILFLVFNEKEILFYQQWTSHESNFFEQLKNKLSLCLVMNTSIKIEHSFIYGSDNDWMARMDEIITVIDEVLQPSKIHVNEPDPFQRMDVYSSREARQKGFLFSHFLMAGGLAMRDIPRW